MNDLIFAFDRDRVLLVKLVQSPFFLEHVFDQSTPTVCHFTQSI